MKNLKDYILEKTLFERVEIINLDEESAPSTTTTDGVTAPDDMPMGFKSELKKSKVFGHPCIEVDGETFHKCIRGKQPFARWSKYVEDEELRAEMRKMFSSNKRMLIVNSRDGSMAYVK